MWEQILNTISKPGIVAAIVSIVTAVLTYFLAPGIKWRYEQKRLRREARVDLISKLRSKINRSQIDDEIGEVRYFPEIFERSVEYSIIKSYFPKELQEEIEAFYMNWVFDRGNTNPTVLRGKILTQISVIEKKWGLI